MNFNSLDKIGYTGYSMINKSVKRMDELVEAMDADDPKSVAKTMVEITKSKAQTARGMTLVRAHEDLMRSTLLLFGIGKCCNCRC